LTARADSSPPLADTLRQIQTPVQDGLRGVLDEMWRIVATDNPLVTDVNGHLLLGKGKMVRPTLLLLASRVDGTPESRATTLAAVAELIHLATLVHDDVLDGASVRRRVASVNQRWDNQVAVLLGDFLYARAFALSTELSSRLCSRVLAETTRRLCVGEIEQSTRRYDFELDQSVYEAISGAKTASLYSAGCELGARYPGGHEEVGRDLAAFGWNLGLAFQIVDDCLDVVGSQETVGKTLGQDVEDGKVTLPVLRTYAEADEALRAEIRDVFTRPGLERRAERLRAACDLGPGVEYAMARAHILIDEAKARIAGLPESRAKKAMQAIADFVLTRNW
jgi:octaprenyl-diphosphate synthase